MLAFGGVLSQLDQAGSGLRIDRKGEAPGLPSTHLTHHAAFSISAGGGSSNHASLSARFADPHAFLRQHDHPSIRDPVEDPSITGVASGI
jgi:hypothetical protein